MQIYKMQDAKGMTALHILLKNYVEFTDIAQKRIADDDLYMYGSMLDDESYMLTEDWCAEDYLKLKCADMIRLFVKKYVQENMLLIDELGFSYFHLIGIIADLSLINSKNIIHINHQINVESLLWPGYSPLHLVALLHDIDTVREFIEKGADMGIKDVKGVTPIDICINRYQVKDYHYLLSPLPIWMNIVLSDGKTRLFDLVRVFTMDTTSGFKKFCKKLPKNVDIYIPHDSPLWPGFSIMHLALLFSKNYKITEDIFNHNPKSLYAQNSCVSTPLDFAFRKKKEAVEALLSLHNKLKDHVDDVNDQQLSCLHVACAVGHCNLVKKLLSSGNNVNVVYRGKSFGPVNSGWTPLHFAVGNNKYSIVKILAQHGADFFAKDVNGMTPVHLLIVLPKNYLHDEYNDLGNLFSLSKYKDSVADDIGLSHLHVACFRGRQDAVRGLLNRGADVNRVINYKPEADNESTFLSGLTKFHGSTPLDLALHKGNKEIVKFLLEVGADVFTKSCEFGEFVVSNILEKYYERISDSDELYLSILLKSDELQKQTERNIGLTKLHIACRMLDLELVKELLDRGANVNAQIHTNSPVWPGYTPLHTLDYSADLDQELIKVQELLKLLLDRKADVMLSNAEGKTPLHMAYEYCRSLSEYSNYSYVNMLLKAQRDFHVNPKSIEGITHFHMACGFNNVFAVKKFLAHAKFDVNQPIDYFLDEHTESAGCTPLHLAVSKRTSNEVAVRLEIADLLLTYGADVQAQDAYGNSPLHKAVECNEKCQDLLERLARGGADLNCRNILGKTPLENLLTKQSEIYSVTLVLTAEEIRYFLKCGCHFNEYNPATGKGYLALALSRLPYQDMKNLVAGVGINYPDAMKVEYKGRTTIHNIVSAKVSNISISEYADLIDQLSKYDCNIDDQDESGQTALRLAVHHQNANAVQALISVGADMGIRDFSGKAAFNYNLDSCSQCDCKEDSDDSNDENEDDLKCDHVEIHNAFWLYVLKLQLCGSYARLLGEFRGDERFGASDLDLHKFLKEEFFVQVEVIQSLTIRSSLVTFGDFLSDTGIVIKYSTMPTITREEIDDFFASDDILRFRDEFYAVSDVIHFQYRKAVKRRNLMEESKKVLVTLTGYCLPDLCSQFVLVHLTNSDFENLITSAA